MSVMSRSIISILKAPSLGKRRTSLHKVRFKVPSDIQKILFNFKTGCNTGEYENLVCTIRDSEISDEDLYKLLIEAKNCISILNYDLRLFIQALICISWAHRSENVIRCYQEFIVDLVSAHSEHTILVINELVKSFLTTEEISWTDWNPSENVVQQYDNVHFILKSVLDLIPMSDNILIDSIKHNFPYLKTSTHKQVSYVYNALKIIQYQPELRRYLLEIIIDKLIAMDVHAPREEIIRLEEDVENKAYEMDVDGVDNVKKFQMKHPVGDTLDIMMGLMFTYIRDECFINNMLLPKSRTLFNELISIFEHRILCIHACHHVQFLMFYICSFDKSLLHEFIKFLWRKGTSQNVPPVIRQTSVAYLSSYLARASYVPLSYLKLYLSKMVEWAHGYISENNYHYDNNVFYAVCQAVFYLIAFRHRDLINSRKELNFLQSLNLSKIVTCKLNPLKVCLPSVVNNFAYVTNACQLVYCYTIMENNSRNTIPVLSNGMIVNSVIDMYFAFDPYVLIRTSSFITPLYKEYKTVIQDQSTEISEKRIMLTGFTEDDDFIDDMRGRSDPVKNNFIPERHE